MAVNTGAMNRVVSLAVHYGVTGSSTARETTLSIGRRTKKSFCDYMDKKVSERVMHWALGPGVVR